MKPLKTGALGVLLTSCILANATSAEIVPSSLAKPCVNIQNVTVTAVYAGWVGRSLSECPDIGNCIAFQYRQGTNPNILTSYIHVNMNLNDGDKGKAMLDMLQTALIHNIRITAFGELGQGSCGSSGGVTGLQLLRS
ncbi:hypothetical protein JOS77_16970 [Chromobacterium haemolyticum]|nr:hypothetical protein JOS77_16970 [Chromobacterium haemolyticum]